MTLRETLLAKMASAAPVARAPDVKQMVFKPPRTLAIPRKNLVHKGPVKQTWASDPREFLSQITQPLVVQEKSHAPLYGCGVLRPDLGPGDSSLEAAAIAAMQVAVLDVDITTPDERAAAERFLAAWGCIYAIYPTFSWTPENPKFKVVVPLSHDAAVDLHHQRHAGLAKIVGVTSDVSAGKPSQRQFGQSAPGEGGRAARSNYRRRAFGRPR